MTSFATLPGDLKSYIADYISTPGDRLALAQTCRAWYHTAIARLYDHIEIDFDVGVELLLPLLSSDNAGLKYIRHVTILSDLDKPRLGSSETDAILELFAHLLPKDQLLSLEVEGLEPLSPRSLVSLHKRQRNISTLRLDGLKSWFGSLYEELHRPETLLDVSKVTTFQLVITSEWSDLDKPFVLPRLPLLANLEIMADLRAACAQRHIDFEDYAARANLSNEILASALCKRPLSPQPSGVVDAPLPLKTLGIQGFDLRLPSQSLLQLLTSDTLTELNLNGCYQAMAPLQLAFSDDSTTMGSLHSFSISSPMERSMRLDVDAINKALRRMSGLRTLLIAGVNSSDTMGTVSSDCYVRLDALQKHQSTLKLLYIDIAHNATKAAISASHSFLDGLSSFHGLEQVAIVQTELWPQHFADHLVSRMTKLSSLRSLYFLEHPKMDDLVLDADPRLWREITGYRLLKIAHTIFTHAPRLSALGFGRRTTSEQTSLTESTFFVRAKEVDLGGTELTTARDVHDAANVREVEPASEIFEVVTDSVCMNRTWSMHAK